MLVAVMEKNVGATRSDDSEITDGKLLPVAGTRAQARERWKRMTLLAVSDDGWMSGWMG